MSRNDEWSSGGVVLREHEGKWQLAVIVPRGKTVHCLPKGHVDAGESAEVAAVREVREETGLRTRLLAPLGDVRYQYRFRGRLIRKKVSFFLLEFESGTIDALDPAMRVEVDKAMWIALEEAPQRLAFEGDKHMVQRALDWLRKDSRGLGATKDN